MRAAFVLAFTVVATMGCPAGDEELRTLLQLPDHMVTPVVPSTNPLTVEKVELGRHLFYDKRLSANQTLACAGCHEQEQAFADGKRTPTGSTGTVLVRNSQQLVNIAYHTTLTWASNNLLTLEDQIQIPIRADDPVELGVTDGVVDEVLARFDDDPMYASMFEAAFRESATGATINKIVFALATFCRTLISARSPYDDFVRGDRTALTQQQRDGLALFNGERFECFHCHGGITFSASYKDTNTPIGNERFAFFNNGLYNVGGDGSYPAQDQGLYQATLNDNDRGLFRPPNLRNVALTAPYMHDGSKATLEDVVRHYAAGGTVTDSGPAAGDGRTSPLKSGLVRGFQATDEEVAAVVAFLETLTDNNFITDPRFANPFPPEQREP
jgi:cytochrome c peroxidase